MIDIIGEISKGNKSVEKRVFDYANGLKEAYFKSDCRIRLGRRVERLKDSWNLKIGSGNWISKVVLPIVKEQMRLTKALTLQYFRQDPVISLEPILDTPHESSVNMQMVLNMNLKATRWRERVWRPLVHSASIVGTAVEFGYYHESEHILKRTVADPFGINQRVGVSRLIQQVRHDNIDILNYFQNPTCIDSEDSDYQGHIDLVTLSELYNAYNNDQDKYIGDNLAKVIKLLTSGTYNKDKDKSVDNMTDEAENRTAADRVRFFGKLNIKGNEDDQTIYYMEWVGETIIRLQANIYDEDVSPYAIFNFEKRYDYWWGNPSAEDLLPHENYLNLLLSIRADKELQSNQRLRLFQKGQLSIADINNRAINDGFVGVELMSGQRLDQVVWEMQHQPDTSHQGSDWITREMKESMSRMSNKVDLSRPAQQGGPQNKTLGAANMMQNQADMQTGDFLESFSYGLSQQGRFDCTVLQQMLDGNIIVRPDIKQASKVLRKPEIIGDFDYVVKTSLQSNNMAEGQRLMNAITQLINFKGTGLPELQAMKIVNLVRTYIRTLDLGEDVDDILSLENNMQQPGAVPSAPPQQAQQMQAMAAPHGAMNAAA